MKHNVGLADDNLPEIIVFGVAPESAIPLLNAATTLLRAGKLPTDAPIAEIANLPVVFKAVSPERAEHHIRVANNRAGRRLPALQMVWPDACGKFPRMPDFDQALLAAQPFLFEAT